jgi:hypothetical protein
MPCLPDAAWKVQAPRHTYLADISRLFTPFRWPLIFFRYFQMMPATLIFHFITVSFIARPLIRDSFDS